MKRLGSRTSRCGKRLRLGEPKSEDDGDDAEDNREDDFGKRQMGQAGGPEGVGVLGEGGKGGEASEEAGGKKGINPGWGGFPGKVAEEATDEEAADEIADEDSHRELVEGGLASHALNAGREAKAGQGTQAATQKNKKSVHEAGMPCQTAFFEQSRQR